MLGLTGKELGVVAKIPKRILAAFTVFKRILQYSSCFYSILSLRNPTHYLLTWLGLKGRR